MARVSIPGQSKATINDPPQRRRAVMISANEVGRVGTFDVDGHIRDDIVPELSGSRGRVVYQRMRADATVSSIIFAIEMMLRRAKWSCVPKDPQDSKCIEYAQFFDSIRGDMYQTWEQFISNCLSMLVYGWSWFEIVGKRRTGADGSPPSKYSDGMWGIHKLAFRSQDSLERWQLNDIGGNRNDSACVGWAYRWRVHNPIGKIPALPSRVLARQSRRHQPITWSIHPVAIAPRHQPGRSLRH